MAAPRLGADLVGGGNPAALQPIDAASSFYAVGTCVALADVELATTEANRVTVVKLAYQLDIPLNRSVT